jgi:hypothetical protein
VVKAAAKTMSVQFLASADRHLVEEHAGVDEGGRHHGRQQQVEGRVAQHLGARAVARRHLGAAGRGRAGRIAAMRQPHRQRQHEHQQDHGRRRPGHAPADHPHHGDDGDRQRRLAGGEAQRHDGERLAAMGMKGAYRRGDGGVEHQPLAEQPQKHDGEEQDPDVARRQHRHQDRRDGEPDDHGAGEPGQRPDIDLAPGADHQHGAGEAGDGIDGAELARREVVDVPDLAIEQRDEEGAQPVMRFSITPRSRTCRCP